MKLISKGFSHPLKNIFNWWTWNWKNICISKSLSPFKPNKKSLNFLMKLNMDKYF